MRQYLSKGPAALDKYVHLPDESMVCDDTRVLVVGPQSASRDALCAFLREKQCRVETADDPEEALHDLWAEEYDSVVLDAQAGEDACLKMIKAWRERSADQTLILQQDPRGRPSALEALKAGADDTMPRPVNAEDLELLALVLHRGVWSHRAMREARRLSEETQNGLSGELERLAHEMNQPLTVIMGTVDLALLEVPQGSPLFADLRSLQREAEKLQRLACQLGALVHPQKCNEG